MTVTVVGIDPGLNGAIAAVRDEHRLVYLSDMPTITEKVNGKDRKYISAVGVSQALRDIADMFPGDHMVVCLEHVSSSPQMGVTSAFNFGHGFGVVEGVVLSKRIQLSRVRPAIWKKKMGFSADKEHIRAEMLRMFPGTELHLKRHADRAEAIALALYYFRENHR